MTKGTGTRSGLLWEVERLLTECYYLADNINKQYGMPQILLMENVPQVHSKANLPDFEEWCKFLKTMGYESYYQDMNARDYGVAQNRNRCFMVSILGNYTYTFPEKIPLKKVMKDYLEEKVDDKYYITSEKAQKLIDTLILEGKIPTKITENEISTVDLSVKKPKTIESANCILARYDCGISNQQSIGSGVCELTRLFERGNEN